MKSRGFKRIWGKPWDYAYLLLLEQRKLKEMARIRLKLNKRNQREVLPLQRSVGFLFFLDCYSVVLVRILRMQSDGFYF